MTARSEFARVREGGQSKGGRFLVMATLEDSALDGCKFGFVTSKRVGNAVIRNRVRRRLRAITREQGGQLQTGRYVVLIARWRAAEASFQELEDDWLKLIVRLGIREEGA